MSCPSGQKCHFQLVSKLESSHTTGCTLQLKLPLRHGPSTTPAGVLWVNPGGYTSECNTVCICEWSPGSNSVVSHLRCNLHISSALSEVKGEFHLIIYKVRTHFRSISSILGLLRESGGMAGWQQAPTGNHWDGHLGSAGRKAHLDHYICILYH